MIHLILIGIVAMLCTLCFTPLVERLARKVRFLEAPGVNRIHKRHLPLGGGVAIYLGFWIAFLMQGAWSSQRIGLLLSSTIVLLLGLIDDYKELSPKAKFIGQIAAAGVLIAYGTRIEFVTNPFGGMVHLAWWSIPVTLLWLVSVMNVVNFIDGLDGLAAGIVAIACVPVITVALTMEQPMAAMMAVALAGSVLGFLPHNFNPARIIMGDAGAMFLGFMLAAISIEGALKGPMSIGLSVSVIALGLPIFDTAFAIVRRFRAGRPIYLRDQGHVHHKLIARGYTQRQAVVLLYALSGCLGALALTLLGFRFVYAVFFSGLGVILVTLIGMHFGVVIRRGHE